MKLITPYHSSVGDTHTTLIAEVVWDQGYSLNHLHVRVSSVADQYLLLLCPFVEGYLLGFASNLVTEMLQSYLWSSCSPHAKMAAVDQYPFQLSYSVENLAQDLEWDLQIQCGCLCFHQMEYLPIDWCHILMCELNCSQMSFLSGRQG